MGVRNLAPKHVGRKEYLMEMPAIFKGESLTRLAQGAAVGAVATMVIGFNWGGWVLGKTAENNATMLVNAALVQAYGPVCIERFKHQPNVEAKWAELTKVDTWRRDAYIQESGFATPPGSTSPNPAVADACADALSKIIAMQTSTAK
jgi:Mg/Co/Ni transporter MgtE